MRLPALLFDLDGTLVDSIELILAAARHAFAVCERPAPSDAEWTAMIGTPLWSQLRQYAADDQELDRLLGAYRSFQREHHDRMTRCYDGTLEVVRALHAAGHPTAVVTSKIEELARRALRLVALEPSIDLVIAADHTSRHKPEPEPVLLALERLGVEPGDAIFVGDSPHDVGAGNAAGVTTVAALWGPFDRPTLEASRPTEILVDIAELPALVARWRGERRLEERAASGRAGRG